MRVTTFTLLAGALVLSTTLFGQAQDSATKQKDVEKKRSMEKINGKAMFEWSEDLKSKDPSVVEQAIATLKVYGPAARREVRLIIRAMGDKDVSLKVNAAITLGFIGMEPIDKDAGVNALKRLLHDPQGIVRYQAARALGRLGPDAFDAVRDLCSVTTDQTSWEIRQAAVSALGNVAWDSTGFDRAAWLACIRRLPDPCSEVRLAAVLSLILFGRPGKVPDLRLEEQELQLLTGEKQVKKVAIWARVALMRLDPDMKEKASEHYLTGISKFLKSKEMVARAHAARALAVIGPTAKTQVPPLIDALEDAENDPFVVVWICVALQNMGDAAKDALPILEKLKAHKDTGVRDAATRAIEDIKEKRRKDDMPEKKKK